MHIRYSLSAPLQVAALANSTGIGGGLFWVPLFNALCGLSLKSSIALSQACVACGTVGASCFSVLQRHSIDGSRPIIDYGLTLVLMPAIITGISAGVLLNSILPSIVLVCILFTILLLVAARTLQQAWRLRALERPPPPPQISPVLENGGASSRQGKLSVEVVQPEPVENGGDRRSPNKSLKRLNTLMKDFAWVRQKTLKVR